MFVKSFQLTATKRTRIVRPGRFFMILESASEISVGFESHGSESGEIAEAVQAGYKRFPGDWSNPDAGKFTAVVLTSATTQTVKIGISDNAADYARVVGIVQVEQAASLSTTADEVVSNVAEIVVAVNAARKAAIIQNVHASENVRIGDSSITASRGVQLQPGQAVTLTTTAAIYAIREGASDTAVSVIEETA